MLAKIAQVISSLNKKKMAEKIYTLSQIAEHKSKKDCWLAINGRVLNVTRFLEEHPGGEEVLMEAGGKDATKQIEEIGHSKAAHELLFNYRVGVRQGYESEDTETSNNASFQEPKKKEMEAFVVKDNGVPKYAALLEFFLGCWFLLCLQVSGLSPEHP